MIGASKVAEGGHLRTSARERLILVSHTLDYVQVQ